MRNFRLPNANLTALIVLCAILIYAASGCPGLTEGKETKKEQFDLSQIKLYGQQQIIVAEASGVATGKYFIDYVVSTPFGEFDPGTGGNRSVSFNNELIRLKIGYDSSITYFSEDAIGHFEEKDNHVMFEITSKYVPPKILDVIPEGFAREENSYFTGSVNQAEFNEFLQRRAKEKGNSILDQYQSEIQGYTQQMLFSQFEKMLRPFFRGKELKVSIKFDGIEVQKGLDGKVLNLDIEDVSLDTTIKHTKVF